MVVVTSYPFPPLSNSTLSITSPTFLTSFSSTCSSLYLRADFFLFFFIIIESIITSWVRTFLVFFLWNDGGESFFFSFPRRHALNPSPPMYTSSYPSQLVKYFLAHFILVSYQSFSILSSVPSVSHWEETYYSGISVTNFKASVAGRWADTNRIRHCMNVGGLSLQK